MSEKKKVKAPIIHGDLVVLIQTVTTEPAAVILVDTKNKPLARQKVEFEVVQLGPLVPKDYGISVGDTPIFQGTPKPIATKMIEAEVDGNSKAYLVFHYMSIIGREDV